LDNQTIKKDEYTLIKDFKEDLLMSYDVKDLLNYRNNKDIHEIVDSFIPVYYYQLIEECFNLTGDVWSRVWLNVDDFAYNGETQSPHDILQNNLYGLYYDCIYKALEEISQEQEEE
tara:strand:+ start:74 stop:421 length:348 start_codon:yes stop_codon:yes gene_type:complete